MSSPSHPTNSESVSGYRKSTAQASFLSYFVSTTPDSEHKRARLKTILFLQASTLLDLEAILLRFNEQSGIFSLEIALIEGKVPNIRAPSPVVPNPESRSLAIISVRSRFSLTTYTMNPQPRHIVRSADRSSPPFWPKRSERAAISESGLLSLNPKRGEGEGASRRRRP